jgi:hypothetical protein
MNVGMRFERRNFSVHRVPQLKTKGSDMPEHLQCARNGAGMHGYWLAFYMEARFPAPMATSQMCVCVRPL